MSWDPVAGATEYEVRRDTSAGGAFSTVAYQGASTAFTDAGLNSSTTHWYKARAGNDAGFGDFSSASSSATTQSCDDVCVAQYDQCLLADPDDPGGLCLLQYTSCLDACGP